MAITEVFQQFLDKHVKQGTALGLQGVVFDKNGIVFEGASGDRLMGKDGGAAQAMKTDTVHWVASCTKIVISIIVLRIIEQGKAKGFTLKQLDDHEALIKLLPEFDHKGDSVLTKIITGYEDKPGPDGKLAPKLKASTNKVTLRQLLTHSIGAAYYWNHPLMKEWYRPSVDSTPNGSLAFISGAVADFTVPLVTDQGGKTYEYSPVTDWLGQFIIRATGKNLRSNYLEEIVAPLGLPKDQTDIMTKHLFKDPSDPAANRAAFYVRLPPSSTDAEPSPAFMHIPLPVYEPPTDDPPAGFAHFASACVHASLPVYARILQAALSHDQRLLSEKTWSLAEVDNTTPKGVSVPYPNMQTFMPDLTYPIDHFFNVDASLQKGNVDETSGINLFQAHTTRVENQSGLAPGAYSWAGLANTYWFVDPASGIGAVFGTQLLPFYDPQMIKARYEWEQLVTSMLKK